MFSFRKPPVSKPVQIYNQEEYSCVFFKQPHTAESTSASERVSGFLVMYDNEQKQFEIAIVPKEGTTNDALLSLVSGQALELETVDYRYLPKPEIFKIEQRIDNAGDQLADELARRSANQGFGVKAVSQVVDALEERYHVIGLEVPGDDDCCTETRKYLRKKGLATNMSLAIFDAIEEIMDYNPPGSKFPANKLQHKLEGFFPPGLGGIIK